MRLPVHLDADVQHYLTERAADKGVSLGEVDNYLLKHEIHQSEGAGFRPWVRFGYFVGGNGRCIATWRRSPGWSVSVCGW